MHNARAGSAEPSQATQQRQGKQQEKGCCRGESAGGGEAASATLVFFRFELTGNGWTCPLGAGVK